MPHAATPYAPAPASRRAGKRLRPDLLLYVLAAFIWVAVWRVQDLVPVLAKMQFPMLMEIITLALFVGNAAASRERQLRWLRSPMFTLLLIIFTAMVLGVPFSIWPGKSFNFLVKDFMPTVLLMATIAVAVREKSDLEWLAFANLVGAVFYSINIYLFFPMRAGRLAGLVYYDANDYALLLVCTLPFALYFMRRGVRFWKRVFALVALGFLVVMIMKSGSRGGFLGLIAVALMVLLRYRSVPLRTRVGAIVLGTTLLMTLGSADYWKMMRSILNPNDDYNMTEPSGRKAIWKRGLGYMAQRPVLGVGVRNFPQAEGQMSEISKQYAAMAKGLKWSAAHNSFVEMGAENGVIALGAFVGIFFVTFRQLARVRAGPASPVTADDAAFAQMITTSLVGFIVAGFFVSAEYFAYLYVLFGLVMGQRAILIRRSLALGTALATPPAPMRPVLVAPRPAAAPPAAWYPSGG